jgi:hypothetical protein
VICKIIGTSPEIAIPLAGALKNDIPEIGRVALAFGPDNYSPWSKKVSAVIKDLPPNSTLQFGVIVPWRSFNYGWVKTASTHWEHNLFRLYGSFNRWEIV